jgi:penicillin-binding protein 2
MKKISFIKQGESKGINFYSSSNKNSEFLLFLLFFSIATFFLILFIRLFQLSITKGDYYRTLSEQNRVREVPIEAPRGSILDRKGYVVAKNTLVSTYSNDNNITVSKRSYQSPEAIAHLIGYRQIATSDDLKNDACSQKLTLGDKIGKKGVEKIYDCQLRGTPGKKIIEVNASGQYLKTIDVIKPIPGNDIQLTFDFELQKKIYQLIAGKKAAVIVTSPKTGEIISLVSSPSFNNQSFENGDQNINQYLESKDKPLFNRVTEGTYPPGSLFKVIVATAALEEKIITDKTEIEDKGSITAGPIKFGNWYFLQYGKTDGMVNIVKAIQRSNDIFFYTIGEKTGVDKIKKWAEIYGLGKATNFGFDESEGLIPSAFWKEETLKEPWYLGDTYNFSIGQGYTLTTPLQMALVNATIANNGYYCQPKLLKNDSPNCKKLPISQETLNLIKEGMKEACSPGGTGWPLFNFTANIGGKPQPIQTACKTGTAESHGEKTLPHAWISVYAPFDNPQIAVTILIEEGGQGSDIAGPIAKEILKAYFERKE